MKFRDVIVKVIGIFCIIIGISTTLGYAGEIEIETMGSLQKGMDFPIKVSIDLLQLEEKVYVVQGQLEYDREVFETVTQEQITLLNGWYGLVFNSDNGMFIIENNGSDDMDMEEMMNINLKTKENFQKKSIQVGIKNIKEIGENEIENELQDVVIEVNLQEDKMSNRILPFTGVGVNLVGIGLVIFIIIGIIMIKKKSKQK